MYITKFLYNFLTKFFTQIKFIISSVYIYIYIYKQQCKIKNQLEDHWFASFRSFIDLPQAIYSKSE